MMIVELTRLENSPTWGTFGVLRIEKQVFCVTLEPADRQNEVNVSSIPAQQYLCQRYQSPSHGETFEITDVPGRYGILFHGGNTVNHTRGCILLGQHFGKLKHERAVMNSGNTFRQFLRRLDGHDMFHLTIHEAY